VPKNRDRSRRLPVESGPWRAFWILSQSLSCSTFIVAIHARKCPSERKLQWRSKTTTETKNFEFRFTGLKCWPLLNQCGCVIHVARRTPQTWACEDRIGSRKCEHEKRGTWKEKVTGENIGYMKPTQGSRGRL
jgi:hypothetical protein